MAARCEAGSGGGSSGPPRGRSRRLVLRLLSPSMGGGLPARGKLLGPKLRDGVFYVSRRRGVCYASLLVFHAFFTRSCFFVLFFVSAGGPRCKRRRFRLETALTSFPSTRTPGTRPRHLERPGTNVSTRYRPGRRSRPAKSTAPRRPPRRANTRVRAIWTRRPPPGPSQLNRDAQSARNRRPGTALAI